MSQEEGEQVEFARSQVDRPAGNLDAARTWVDDDIGAGDAIGADELTVVVAAPEDSLHTGDEFAGAERLREVVIGAGFEAGDAVHFVAPGGEHDDRRLRLFADAAADLHAPKAREHEVQDHEVRADGRVGLHGGQPISGRVDAKSFTLEIAFDNFDDNRFVVHNEDARGFHADIVAEARRE